MVNCTPGRMQVLMMTCRHYGLPVLCGKCSHLFHAEPGLVRLLKQQVVRVIDELHLLLYDPIHGKSTNLV